MVAVEEDDALGPPKQRHETKIGACYGAAMVMRQRRRLSRHNGVKEDSKDSFVCLCCWFAVGASSGAHVAYTKSKSHILCSSWCGMMCVCKCVEQLTSAGSGYISRLPGTFCIGEGVGSQVKPVRCSLRKMQPLKKEKPNQTKTSTTTTTNGI